MRVVVLAAALVALAAAGCGSEEPATVKGRLVENGNPKEFAPSTVAVQLSPVGGDGKADAARMFTAVVNADGSFEVVASGGKLPPGKYVVEVRLPGKGKNGPNTVATKRDLKAGPNDLTIDLAKPEG